MDDDREMTGISVVRLFPLPGVVSFPHCVLPLHIFEPRYRLMTEDALEGDRLITIVMVRPDAAWTGPGPPALEEFGCVGRIVKHERLPDGRFNMLLLGLKRVRIVREVPGGKLYRSAEVEFVDDIEGDGPEVAGLRAGLVAAFRGFLKQVGGGDSDLESVLSSEIELGILADLLAHSLPLPPEIKQVLLAEPRVEARVASLTRLVEGLGRTEDSQGDPAADFPPAFSQN